LIRRSENNRLASLIFGRLFLIWLIDCANVVNNFEPLCHACHVDKTNKSFSRGKYKTIPMFTDADIDTEINFGLFKPESE